MLTPLTETARDRKKATPIDGLLKFKWSPRKKHYNQLVIQLVQYKFHWKFCGWFTTN